jgi:hypothetical protein
MTPAEARRILQFHRAGTPDADSAEVIEALALTRSDPELRAWFEQQLSVEQPLRQKLRSISPPATLRDQILLRGKTIVLTPWHRRPSFLAAVAMLVLLGISAYWWLRPAPPDRFADYRNRMVSSVLRSYHMDIETDDPAQVREFMARRGSPADFEVPNGLARLELTGGGLLQWRGHPVSMVCFDRGDARMLFLFVLRRHAIADAPPAGPQVEQVNKLTTLSWSRGENVYLLAGSPENGFPEQYP